MWLNKLCSSRNLLVLRSSYPTSQYRVNRTFSILSTINENFKSCRKHIKTIKFLNKPVINFNALRRQGTTLQALNSRSYQRQVGFWLLGCSGMVYMAIVIGGYTRLTESGLSMVTWRLTFEKYPSSEEEWVNEFKKYQEYPEYKQLKRDITLEEFKKIWQTEYFHRLWGRLIGVAFIIPAAGFWARGYFLPGLKKRILAFGSLIGAQGLLGWYMVKSGLEDRFHKDTDIPRVSQYRLASHLGLAMLLYTGLLWTAADLLLPPKAMELKQCAKRLKIMTHCCKGMVFLTALTGAFVAGLDAGLVYNSFPKMGDKWIPDDILAFKPIYSNFTENPTTVQFIHRIMGITTFTLSVATCIVSKRYVLPRTVKIAMSSLFIIATYQAFLGYYTLVSHVPVDLASAHQSGAILLLSAALLASHQLKKVKYLPK